MSETDLDVIGLGNAIVDVLTEADDAFLESQGMTKGAMTLIDEPTAHRLYDAMGETSEVSGGSAANTMVGIASLGGRSAYVGKTAADGLGGVFREGMTAEGVEFATAPAGEGPATGRCLVMVTPDAQRTMGTFLGASATLGPEDVDEAQIARAKITYLEGYLWDPAPAKQAFLKAAQAAKDAGRQVSLSLSDAFCVDRHRDSFLELVADHVDLLFANEDEIQSLFQADFNASIAEVRRRCKLAAITRGPAGSVVVVDGQTLEVPAHGVSSVVDTTGAGDLYAAGFLAGATRGESWSARAELGGLAAAEIIAHFGARPQQKLESWVAAKR